jgi:hypothetical protein
VSSWDQAAQCTTLPSPTLQVNSGAHLNTWLLDFLKFLQSCEYCESCSNNQLLLVVKSPINAVMHNST